MPIKEVIELSADDKKLLQSLANINKKLKETQKEAKKVGDTAGSSIGGKFVGALSKAKAGVVGFVSAVGGAVKMVGRFLAGLAKLAVIMGGAFWLGLKALKSGFDDIEKGIRNILQLRALGPIIGKLGEKIQFAVKGIVDMNNIADFIRKGKGIGLSGDQIQKLVEMGTSIGLVSNKVDELRATEMLFEAVTKGTVDELSNVAPALGLLAKKAIEGKQGLTSMSRALLVKKAILGDYAATLDRTGNVLESSFAKILGFVRRAKEESQGLLEVLAGIGKSLGAVLLPLGAGLAGFAINPLTGIIGVILGGAMSTVLAVIGTRMTQMLHPDNKGGTGRMGAFKTIAENMIGGAFDALGKGDADITTPLSVLQKAFPGVDVERLKELYGSIAQVVANVTKVLRALTEGFFETFIPIVGDITKAVSPETLANFKSFGQQLGVLAGALVNAIPKIVDLIPAIIEFVGKTDALILAMNGIAWVGMKLYNIIAMLVHIIASSGSLLGAIGFGVGSLFGEKDGPAAQTAKDFMKDAKKHSMKSMQNLESLFGADDHDFTRWLQEQNELIENRKAAGAAGGVSGKAGKGEVRGTPISKRQLEATQKLAELLGIQNKLLEGMSTRLAVER